MPYKAGVATLTELIMIVGQNRAEIVDALKTKYLLERMGMGVMGVIMKESTGQHIPPEVVEDILRLKIVANYNVNA